MENSERRLDTMNTFCMNLLYFYPIDELIPGLPPNHIGILMVMAGVLNVVTSLVTIIWIKSKEKEAQMEGDEGEDAAKSVIFPVFVQVVWLNVFINLYAGVVETFLPFNPVGENYSYIAILYGLIYGLRHLVTEGLAFLLMKKGCGKHAAKEAGYQALLWGMITFSLLFLILYKAGVTGRVITFLLDLAVFVFYLALWKAPLQKLYRRPAAIFYSKFWALYRFLAMCFDLADFFEETNDASACGYIFVNLVLFAIVQPIFCYWTLLLDSRWWQGIEIQSNRNRTESYENIRAPLIGSDFSLTTAQSLADTVDRIRVQGQVKMLNFACIKIDFRSHLGAGSFSKVYKGTYRGKECAIKLIYTVDLTTDVIQRVAAEASILSSIRHPNIVNILGVSVLPPSVCLILELCEFGSLSDIIRGYGFDWSTSHRAPLTLAKLDILHFALGCARGLAAVHAYDKSICHRDVKSFNFLVDSHFTVKIADLELGVLRSKDRIDPVAVSDNSFGLSGHHEELMSAFSDPNLVVVEELLANWMAPEVIVNRRFQQASDVYALGTVLWELVSKELPYENETQVEIRRKILSGYKHKLPEHVIDTPLGILIDRCWDSDPAHRPSAFEICEILENILKDSFTELTKDHPIKYIPNFSTLKEFYEAAYRKSNNFINTGSSETQSGATMTLPQYLWKSVQIFNPFSWYRQDAGNMDDDAEHLVNRDSLNNRMSDPVMPPSIYGNSSVAPSAGRPSVAPSTSMASNKSIFNFPFRFSSQQYERESEYILPNYLSKKNMLNIIMPPAALEAIRLVKQEKFWFELEGSDEAWAILTPEYPFILTHATSKWYELFNVPSSFGIDFQLLSLISLLFPEIEAMNLLCSASNTYIQNATQQNKFRNLRIQSSKEFIQHLKLHQELHTILCMHLPYMTRRPNSRHHTSRSKSSNKNRMDFLSSDSSAEDFTNSFSIDTTGRINGHNMMCSVHAFPVFVPSEYVNLDLLSNNGEVPPSPSRVSVQKSPTPLSVPESPRSTPVAQKSALRKSSKVPAPLNISNNSVSQPENRIPLYYAILFNELKEEEVNLPEKVQPQQNYFSKNSNLHQYNSRKSKMSDLTTGTGLDDDRIDDEYHNFQQEQDEADEIYNTENISNLADHSTSYQDNQHSLWKNITKLWSSGNDKSDDRKPSTNSRTVTQLLSGEELSNPVGKAKGSRTHSFV